MLNSNNINNYNLANNHLNDVKNVQNDTSTVSQTNYLNSIIQDAKQSPERSIQESADFGITNIWQFIKS